MFAEVGEKAKPFKIIKVKMVSNQGMIWIEEKNEFRRCIKCFYNFIDIDPEK